MRSVQSILTNADFGSRIAEDELDKLKTYFVETESWRSVVAGEVDVVFGAKGAGKSALYSLLVSKDEEFRLGRRTIFLPAENPRGTPAFRDLTTAPALSEEAFRGLWKLYFLSILANYIRGHTKLSNIKIQQADDVIDFLTANGLLAPGITLGVRLKAAMEYLRKWFPSFEGGFVDPNTGIKLTGKVTLGEPSEEQRGLGYRSIDHLLSQLNNAFETAQITAWLVLDRLDVAFADSEELEGNALRSLFRTYLDMRSLSQFKVKIFLRDDIWERIVKDGFREASHVTRTLSLQWDQQSLLHLLVSRLASNVLICDHYGVTAEEVMANSLLQKSLFDKAFPAQVDRGGGKSKTLSWMINRTADGTKRTAPRELIHLLLSIRDEQLKILQVGGAEPPENQLFDKAAIRSAMPIVSKTRYTQTLCAEHPNLIPYLSKLERAKAEQNTATLASIWKVGLEEAQEIAERLVQVGFFERRIDSETTSFWVPFLYREALDLVQGAATRKQTKRP